MTKKKGEKYMCTINTGINIPLSGYVSKDNILHNDNITPA